MLTKLYYTFTSFIDDELTTSRYLFSVLSIGFLIFAIWGDNVPIKGPISHVAINLFDSAICFTIFLFLFFSNNANAHYQKLGYLLIYVLNLGNIYLLYGTSFEVQTAYQFILVYLISGWFFRKEKDFTLYFLVHNLALFFTGFISDHTTKTTFDFYATYLIAAMAQVVLIRNRFNIEDKLADSEKKYRLVAENSFDLICIHNADGTLEFVSPSIKRLLGYKPEEMQGRRAYEITHPEDLDIIRVLDLHDRNNPALQQPSQYRLQHKNGSYVWIETVFVPLESEDGKTSVVLSQSRDIRRSKKYQQELEERTRELERSNADLETFAFVSSHDMQEPLRMISNYMQLLKKRFANQLDTDANEYIDFANDGASRLQQLIRDLLSYSRITRTELKKNTIDMNVLLQDTLRIVDLDIKEKNAFVKYDDLKQVESDRTLLMLVIQNLLLNGIKYNESAIPEISIICYKQDKDMVYRFTDNGIGIKKEHQQRIFEPFHRLHTKAEYPGTGLGLSICKKIVERMGGSIWVESEVGKGTSFYFSIPV